MTNKDTERLVRQAMQQTIPDKEALWAKIESELPAQPAFGGIRKTPGRMRVVYRVMGAAACFLLIAGGIGIWSAAGGRHFAKMENATMNADAPKREESAAPAADAAADMADEAPAEAEAAEDAGPIRKSPADAPHQSMEGAMASARADEKNAPEDTGAEIIIQELIVKGAYMDADERVSAPVLGKIMEEMPPAEAQLQELVALEPVQNDGVYLAFRYQEKQVILTALDGRYRMIVDGRTFPAPAKARELLIALED